MIWPTEEKILWKFCNKLEMIRRELAQLQPMDCMIAVSHYSENLSDIQQMKKEVLKMSGIRKRYRMYAAAFISGFTDGIQGK